MEALLAPSCTYSFWCPTVSFANSKPLKWNQCSENKGRWNSATTGGFSRSMKDKHMKQRDAGSLKLSLMSRLSLWFSNLIYPNLWFALLTEQDWWGWISPETKYVFGKYIIGWANSKRQWSFSTFKQLFRRRKLNKSNFSPASQKASPLLHIWKRYQIPFWVCVLSKITIIYNNGFQIRYLQGNLLSTVTDLSQIPMYLQRILENIRGVSLVQIRRYLLGLGPHFCHIWIWKHFCRCCTQ